MIQHFHYKSCHLKSYAASISGLRLSHRFFDTMPFIQSAPSSLGDFLDYPEIRFDTLSFYYLKTRSHIYSYSSATPANTLLRAEYVVSNNVVILSDFEYYFFKD